jgi:UDP-glucose:(heptosyl)LPS alpha-1,3-glucosyltransferase
MRVAIVLHRDFPTGGLQRDARALAGTLAARGHAVALISRSAEGEPPAGVERRLVPVPGGSNHAQDLAFAAAFRGALREGERVVGFDKLPGLDLYFAADLCWKALHGWRSRMTPRGQARQRLESSVCDRAGPPIAALTAEQRASYARAYDLPLDRFLVLPPLRDAAYRPTGDPAAARLQAREALGLGGQEPVALFVGHDAQRKGLDRVLRALADLGERAPRLLCVGQPSRRHLAEVARLGLQDRFSRRPSAELPLCYAAADLLLHPARSEAGGKVIAEALGYGLAVLCTEVCGYGWLVADSGAGALVPEPFRQKELSALLAAALRTGQLARWRRRALAAQPRLFAEDAIECLADAVERLPIQRATVTARPVAGLARAPAAAALLPPLSDGMAWLFGLSGQTRRREAGRETLAVTLAGQPLFLKRHGGTGWGEIVKNWLVLKRPVLGARQEWRALHELAALGVAAPQALAFAEQGRNPARRRSALLMAALPPGEAIEDRLQQEPPLDEAERCALARGLGLLLRRVHGAGIAHRDLYICHVFRLVDGRIAVLDWHRALIRRRLSRRWRAKDLAALAYSSLPYGLDRRDRLRFLSAYHALPLRLAASRFQPLWRQVERRVARLQVRSARRLSG